MYMYEFADILIFINIILTTMSLSIPAHHNLLKHKNYSIPMVLTSLDICTLKEFLVYGMHYQ